MILMYACPLSSDIKRRCSILARSKQKHRLKIVTEHEFTSYLSE
jgi:hypothetical protein